MKKAMVALLVIVGLLGVTLGATAQIDTDALIPGIASFLIPGLGQLLNDQMDKAILHFAVDVGIIGLGYYAGTILPFGYYLIPALHLAWAIYSGVDAYNVAKDMGFSIGQVENGIGFAFTF